MSKLLYKGTRVTYEHAKARALVVLKKNDPVPASWVAQWNSRAT